MKPNSDSPQTISSEELTRRNVDIVTAIEKAFHAERTPGQKMADVFASVIGSWPFILAQSFILVVWMFVNILGWLYQWDPYPFILLNLCLSLQAAFASPIIMMSQNRASQVNEKRNHLDLQVNLLAEQEATETLKLLRKICEHLKIEMSKDGMIEAMAGDVHPQTLVDQIEGSNAKKGGKDPEKK